MNKVIDYFKNRNTDDGKISTLWSLLYPAVAGLIFGLVYWNFVTLPDPLMYSDENSNPHDFIAENAKMYLRNLTSQGPRVAGSDVNEIFTVNFLMQTIEDIKRQAHPSHQIEVEVQRATGGMHLDYDDYPMTSYYKGLQNVVVRVEPASKRAENALLLNSHFDSVPSSPGGGDDGTMVVIMLECLRKIVQVESEFRHAIIFLFNGSEENTLQGSHAFITLHRWAADVRVVINLDVAANGGREIMFQAGPDHPWLMNYYRKHIRHPYANTMGEELFQADLVPSETDYKNFVDFGHIPGMDFAHSTNGYFYHTKYDGFDTIPLDTLQHTGDNILAITKAIANSGELDDIEAYAEGKVVYFDFLNWFMIYYSEGASVVINVLVAAAAIALTFLSLLEMQRDSAGTKYVDFLKILGIGVGIQFLAIIVGAGFAFFLAFFFDLCNRSMTWFTENWLIFGLYFIPFMLGACLCSYLYFQFGPQEKLISLSYRVQIFQHAQLFILALLLVVLTAAGIRSGYIVLITVLFYTLTLLINVLTTLQSRGFHWVYVMAIGQIIPFSFYSALTLTAFGTFIAMAGRGNSQANPEIIIALFSVLMALFMSGFMIPLMNLMRRPIYVIVFFVLIICITAILMATPVGFPFQENETPQRYSVFHIERIIHEQQNYIRKEGSFFYMHPLDRHSPDYIREYVPQMKIARKLGRECDEELYCGIPFYLNTYHKQSKNSHWIPASKPYFYVVPRLNRTEEIIGPDLRRNYFTVSGPDHMSFYISPVVEAELVGWSFVDFIPEGGKKWNDREVYFVNYFYGVDKTDFEFYIDIKIRDTWAKSSFIFALAAQYMHNDDERTDDFVDFINKFPDFANVIGYMSYYESWEF